MEQMQPNDVSSEKALLGCILTKNETLETALEFVTKNDFYNQRNRAIFEVMESMYSSNEVIEILSLFKKNLRSLKTGLFFIRPSINLQAYGINFKYWFFWSLRESLVKIPIIFKFR
mgnify:CR=1 FL=1